MKNNAVSIKRALISVSDKQGLVELARILEAYSVEILSTGGSAKLLRDHGIAVKEVADYTGFPEIMDGRVKTLHPNIHGGLLAKRDKETHKQAMIDHDIKPIDLVIINLYPFQETVAKGLDEAACIEQIDIGGPAMIRSAAKNHDWVSVVTSPEQYQLVIDALQQNGGSLPASLRRTLAIEAFDHTAGYDQTIADWFVNDSGENPPNQITMKLERQHSLRYGENPHQKAALYRLTNSELVGVAGAQQIQGKTLGYNNYADADAALQLVKEFHSPAAAIIKHANPCGVGLGQSVGEAYAKALASDPLSAFGGVVAVNRKIDENLARQLINLFLEVIIAPAIDETAIAILATKPNMRVLIAPEINKPNWMVKSLSGGGFLLQDEDNAKLDQTILNKVTEHKITDENLSNLLFAWHVCKHVKSNAIVIAVGYQTTGIGAGQMSRVDAAKLAVSRHEHCLKSLKPLSKEQAIFPVVASDAFFPFPDGVELLAKAGVKAIIQPGGAMRDETVIKAANDHKIAMFFTGIRHFKH